MVALFFILGLIYISIIVFYIICSWKLYVKAGREGWESIIPIYSTLVMLKIVGKPWWWIFLVIFLFPIFAVWTVNMLSKSFGKDEAFTVGLLLLGGIFLPILALSKKIQYQGPYGNPVAYKAFREKSDKWDFENKNPQ